MKNWSLSKKIWSVLGLLAFAFVGSTYFALTSLSSVKHSLEEITTQDVTRDALASDIQRIQGDIALTILEGVLIKDAEALAKNKAKYDEDLKLMSEDMGKYEALASAQEKVILAEYKKLYSHYLKIMGEVRAHSLKNENDEAAHTYLSSDEDSHNMRAKMIELNQLTAASLEEKSQAANTTAREAVWTGLIVSTSSILLSMLIAFFVLRAVTRSINDVVKHLFDSSLQVSSAASQIASSSEELSQAATEQAASLEETAASIEEMNSMVSKSSENASSAASTSTKSQEKASLGKDVVEKMIQSMDAINESNNTIMNQVNQSNENMAGIVKVIEEIGSKTKVINDIVFQTKLLSFNASVEAARAGEHGKGFAVVAEEVGNLAQMSGNAAKEISTMLEDSIQRVNRIVQETKSGVEKLIAEGKETVASGSKVAKECGEVLDEIVHNVSSVASMADEIASASREQSRGVTEITKAMGQLDQMTQQNAAVSEECASSAEELSAQSESLKNSVAQLVATINGANHKHQEETHKTHSDKTHSEPKSKTLKSSSKGAHTNKVVHLKNTYTASSDSAAYKRAAGGDTPDYNNQGFEDI